MVTIPTHSITAALHSFSWGFQSLSVVSVAKQLFPSMASFTCEGFRSPLKGSIVRAIVKGYSVSGLATWYPLLCSYIPLSW